VKQFGSLFGSRAFVVGQQLRKLRRRKKRRRRRRRRRFLH